jgi:hypothetical protein
MELPFYLLPYESEREEQISEKGMLNLLMKK